MALTVAGKRYERSADRYRIDQVRRRQKAIEDEKKKREEREINNPLSPSLQAQVDQVSLQTSRRPETNEITRTTINRDGSRTTTETRSVGVNAGGVQQIPGLQTQTVQPRGSGAVIRDSSEQPFKERSFFTTARQEGVEVALAQERAQGNIVSRFLSGGAQGVVEPTKAVTQFVGDRLQNALTPGVNPDAIKIIGAVRGFQKEPLKKLDAGYGAVGQALISTASSVVEDPVGGTGELAGNLALGELAGRAAIALKGEPLVASSLRGAGRIIENPASPVSIEAVSTKGTVSATSKLTGAKAIARVEAETIAPTFRATTPTKTTPGISLQEQYTNFKTSGALTAEGKAYADLEIKSLGKKSVGTGRASTAIVTNKGKLIITDAELATYSRLAKENYVFPKTTSKTTAINDLGVRELKFDLNKPKSVTTSATEVFNAQRTVRKLGVDEAAPTFADTKVNLETAKYFTAANKELGLNPKYLPREVVVTKTKDFYKFEKPETLTEFYRGTVDVPGEGFVLREQVDLARDIKTVQTKQRITGSVSKGGTSNTKIDTSDYLDIKGFKEPSSGYYVIDEGKESLITGLGGKEIEIYRGGGTALKQLTQQVKVSKVAPVTEASIKAQLESSLGQGLVSVVKQKDLPVVKAAGRTTGATFSLGKTRTTSNPRIVYSEPDFKVNEIPILRADSSFKSTNIIAVDQQRKVASVLDQESLSKLRRASTQRQRPIERNVQDTNLVPETIITIKSIQDFKQEQKLKQAQDLIQQQETIREYNTKLPLLLSRPPTKPVFTYATPKKKTGTEEYLVEVGKPTNKYYFNLGIGGQELLDKAKSLARGTAAASVKVTPLRGARNNARQVFGSDFYVNREGRYVQSTRTRISSSGEKRQIPGEAQRKRKQKITIGKAKKYF